MAVVMGQYELVAETIVDRTAELLSTRVAVTDARGVVIASSERESVGLLASIVLWLDRPLARRVIRQTVPSRMKRFPCAYDCH